MEGKARHGCVTAWLVFMIVVNSITALMYFFGGDAIMGVLPDVNKGMILLLGVIGLANVGCAILLFQWKKIGFWGFVATSVITMGIRK